MKLSEFIKKYGDCEVTEEMEKCIYRKSNKWMPKNNEKYWFTDSFGSITCCNWTNHSSDIFRRGFMKIFKTKEDLKRYLEIIKACKEASFEPNWEDANQCKYVIIYDGGNLRIYYYYVRNSGEPFYFESKEIAQGLIDKFGDKDIAKYLFNIEID